MPQTFTFGFIFFLSIPFWGNLAGKGEAEVESLDPFYISGTRLPGSETDLLVSGESLSRQKLEMTNPSSLLHGGVRILTSSMFVSDSGVPAASSEVYLQGGEPNFTMVLLDGIRINDPTNTRGGGANFALIDPWAVQRLTIRSGSQSSIHGSEGLNGVIALSLVDEEPVNKGEVRFELGTKEYIKAGVFGSYELAEDAQFNAGLTYLDSGEPVPGGTFEAWRGNLGSAFRLGELTRVRVSGFFANTRRTNFPDDSGGFHFAEIRDLDQGESEAQGVSVLVSHPLNDVHQLEFLATGFSLEDSLQSPGVAPGLRDPFGIPANDTFNDFSRWSVQLFDRVDLGDRWQVALGGSFSKEKGKSDSVLKLAPGFEIPGEYVLERDMWSGFGELQLQPIEDVTLRGELRWDNPEGDTATWSPKLSGRWDLESMDSSLTATLGRGYKLPSFFALGNPVVGNPDLRKEEADSLLVGWESYLSNLQLTLGLQGFGYRYRDLVDFSSGPPPQLKNLSEVEVTGATLYSRVFFNSYVQVEASVTFQDVEVKDSHETLLLRPDWSGMFGIYVDFRDELDMGWVFQYVGERQDSSIPTGDRSLDAYHRSDLTLAYEAWSGTTLRLTLDNLFNNSWEEKIGFPGITRRLRVMASHEF